MFKLSPLRPGKDISETVGKFTIMEDIFHLQSWRQLLFRNAVCYAGKNCVKLRRYHLLKAESPLSASSYTSMLLIRSSSGPQQACPESSGRRTANNHFRNCGFINILPNEPPFRTYRQVFTIALKINTQPENDSALTLFHGCNSYLQYLSSVIIGLYGSKL